MKETFRISYEYYSVGTEQWNATSFVFDLMTLDEVRKEIKHWPTEDDRYYRNIRLERARWEEVKEPCDNA